MSNDEYQHQNYWEEDYKFIKWAEEDLRKKGVIIEILEQRLFPINDLKFIEVKARRYGK